MNMIILTTLIFFITINVGESFSVVTPTNLKLNLSIHPSTVKTSYRSPCKSKPKSKSRPASASTSTSCRMASDNDDDKSDFWESQKNLAASMTEFVDEEDTKELRMSEKEKYNNQVNGLVAETFYFGIMFFSIIWYAAPNPFTAFSYLLGAMLGAAYCYGLGRYVQTLGGSAYDLEDVKGSGVGSARFAFLIVLFILVGKFRSVGLQEIPAIMGFFTYQISTLSQGLKESSE